MGNLLLSRKGCGFEKVGGDREDEGPQAGEWQPVGLEELRELC